MGVHAQERMNRRLLLLIDPVARHYPTLGDITAKTKTPEVPFHTIFDRRPQDLDISETDVSGDEQASDFEILRRRIFKLEERPHRCSPPLDLDVVNVDSATTASLNDHSSVAIERYPAPRAAPGCPVEAMETI